MTAKEYLQQIYIITKRISRLRRLAEQLRSDAYSIGSPMGNMSPDKVQTSFTGDKMERMIARMDKADRNIRSETERLHNQRIKIQQQIESVDDERYRSILFGRYVLCETGRRSLRMFHVMSGTCTGFTEMRLRHSRICMLMILNRVIECQYTGLIYDMLTEWQERIPPKLTGFLFHFLSSYWRPIWAPFILRSRYKQPEGVMNEKDKPKIQERLTTPEAPGKVQSHGC